MPVRARESPPAVAVAPILAVSAPSPSVAVASIAKVARLASPGASASASNSARAAVAPAPLPSAPPPRRRARNGRGDDPIGAATIGGEHRDAGRIREDDARGADGVRPPAEWMCRGWSAIPAPGLDRDRDGCGRRRRARAGPTSGLRHRPRKRRRLRRGPGGGRDRVPAPGRDPRAGLHLSGCGVASARRRRLRSCPPRRARVGATRGSERYRIRSRAGDVSVAGRGESTARRIMAPGSRGDRVRAPRMGRLGAAGGARCSSVGPAESGYAFGASSAHAARGFPGPGLEFKPPLAEPPRAIPERSPDPGAAGTVLARGAPSPGSGRRPGRHRAPPDVVPAPDRVPSATRRAQALAPPPQRLAGGASGRQTAPRPRRASMLRPGRRGDPRGGDSGRTGTGSRRDRIR